MRSTQAITIQCPYIKDDRLIKLFVFIFVEGGEKTIEYYMSENTLGNNRHHKMRPL